MPSNFSTGPSTGATKETIMSDFSLITFPASHDRTSSTKPLIVLVHGGALSHRMFRTMIPIMNAHGFDLAAVDLPGHGSSVSMGPFTFDAALQHLSEGVRKLRENSRKIVLVGVSLGGQVVLDLLQRGETGLLEAAVVSGASIQPPDDQAPWEMPHMPTDQEWINIMMEDVRIMGMDNAKDIQDRSFAFTFDPQNALPPVLVVVGEHDTAMSKRDYPKLTALAKKGNHQSESVILDGAWHNHPIDIPERFAALIEEWVGKRE